MVANLQEETYLLNLLSIKLYLRQLLAELVPSIANIKRLGVFQSYSNIRMIIGSLASV